MSNDSLASGSVSSWLKQLYAETRQLGPAQICSPCSECGKPSRTGTCEACIRLAIDSLIYQKKT